MVPVWRDSEALLRLLHSVPDDPRVEVAIGATATDASALRAAVRGFPRVTVTAAPPGRAAQMNAAARTAAGAWLLFLHADSRLPEGWMTVFERLSSSDVVGGAFRFALDDPGWRARVIERGVAARVRLFHLPYGDQGLFVRRTIFDAAGGFPSLPLMEDVAFVRRMRQRGPLHFSTLAVVTSARRWHRDGWVRRTTGNWLLLLQYLAGADVRRLARRYTNRRDIVLAVLARAPSAGGKSRLFASLGRPFDPALGLALLSDTLRAAGAVDGVDRAIVYTPPDAYDEIRAAAGDAPQLLAQRGSDLGARMAAAIDDLLGLGYAGVVLIGSDLPTVPPAALRLAADALQREDCLVIGPAEDGGFYLLGARRPIGDLFAGIEWSTPRVFDETVAAARRLGIRVVRTPAWFDVDDADSLARAAADERAVHTRVWCAAQDALG